MSAPTRRPAAKKTAAHNETGTASTTVAGVPALTAPRRARGLSTTDVVLDNGLRVLVVRKPGVPLAEVRLRVPFLSARSGHSARAALLADTILTGTQSRDRAALAAAIQALGADLQTGVDADRLLFSGNVLATNLRPLLALLAEIIASAAYRDADVVGERDRLVEKLTIARSRSAVVAAEALARRMYGSHPYASDLPQPEEVRATGAAALRRLHTDLIRPEGSVLVVVGDVSPARVVDQIQAALRDWTGTPPRGRIPALPAIAPGPFEVVHRDGSVQSSLRLGGPALRRSDPRYAALQLANTVFGGYFSSRWTENLREDKGYTYGPHSRLEHNVLGSSLVLDAEVATEVTAPAVLETVYELGRLASLPVTSDEVEAVRQYSIGTLALSTATQAGLASTLSGLVGNGLDPSWLQEHPGNLAKVSVEEVSAVAAEFFAPTRLVGVVVGDAGVISEPLAKIVAVGP
ncbi:MAG: insulinase family protein [Actinobacteria bacterium]|nr:insulinase family protein [Actinomycetota bacterium]